MINKVIVTGATSMIGVALVKCLLLDMRIRKIYVVCRPNTNKYGRLPQDDRIVRIDCTISDYEKIPMFIDDKCDVFFHLAWERTDTYNENANDILIKWECAEGVLKAVDVAHRLSCKKFVCAGSQSEYGILSEKANPNATCNPIRADGIAHLAAYKMAKILADQSGIKLIWIRVFSVYGIYDRDNSLVMSTIKKLKNGEHCSFTSSTQKWEFLNEEDAGRAFYMAGLNGEDSKIYCLGSGEEHPLRYYIEFIRDTISPGTELGFGELPYPENPIMRLCADNTSLINDTGWKPRVTFEEGIRSLVKYYEER